MCAKRHKNPEAPSSEFRLSASPSCCQWVRHSAFSIRQDVLLLDCGSLLQNAQRARPHT